MEGKILTEEVFSVKFETGGYQDRCARIINWIVNHQDEVNLSRNGNITFSFVDSTLKAKMEKYENI